MNYNLKMSSDRLEKRSLKICFISNVFSFCRAQKMLKVFPVAAVCHEVLHIMFL